LEESHCKEGNHKRGKIRKKKKKPTSFFARESAGRGVVERSEKRLGSKRERGLRKEKEMTNVFHLRDRRHDRNKNQYNPW